VTSDEVKARGPGWYWHANGIDVEPVRISHESNERIWYVGSFSDEIDLVDLRGDFYPLSIPTPEALVATEAKERAATMAAANFGPDEALRIECRRIIDDIPAAGLSDTKKSLGEFVSYYKSMEVGKSLSAAEAKELAKTTPLEELRTRLNALDVGDFAIYRDGIDWRHDFRVDEETEESHDVADDAIRFAREAIEAAAPGYTLANTDNDIGSAWGVVRKDGGDVKPRPSPTQPLVDRPEFHPGVLGPHGDVDRHEF
jgi:hypothetical protein